MTPSPVPPLDLEGCVRLLIGPHNHDIVGDWLERARWNESYNKPIPAEQCRKNAAMLQRLALALPELLADSARLDWWFANGLKDSVCEGSVDLWWADEQDGDAVERVTHGTSVRNAMDKAMRGIYDPEATDG